MTDAQPTAVRLISIAALATGLVLWLAACGDDDAGSAGNDDFAAQAALICSDGAQEAIALPLPTSPKQVRADAEAMAEVLLKARDAIEALGAPSGQQAEAAAYLAELDADIGQLERTAGSGELEPLDESAGQAALELGLNDCAGFANAVARTP